MNTQFGWLAKLFNQFFGKLCPEYPGYPEFSIWRIMTKIWVNEVLEPNFKTLRKVSMHW